MFTLDFSGSLLMFLGIAAIGLMFLGVAFKLIGHWRIGQAFLIFACLFAAIGFFQHAAYMGRDLGKYIIHELDTQCNSDSNSNPHSS